VNFATTRKIKRNVIRKRIKDSPLKMCYCPWFKHFDENLVDSKVAAWTWSNEGTRVLCFWSIFTNT
jgi:hypothetical protein